MCNVYGTMHGECAAYMLDPAKVAPAILLGLAKGFDGTGVSQSMNVHWHHPAPLCVFSLPLYVPQGATVSIITRCIFADGRARLSCWEIGKLIVSSTHMFLNAGHAVKL
ncbi:hypothetical protein B0H17DRAFT_1101483 [Mycena rosella]|uniref:Thioesterase domain-containing protein n=1 Tax=Mycena rosella TaxID=1033263 RepID=A0AAD7CLW4_MYCRO|nr:hypothetical protein B0H17DRAFT_1101483 [Mycena rosella]